MYEITIAVTIITTPYFKKRTASKSSPTLTAQSRLFGQHSCDNGLSGNGQSLTDTECSCQRGFSVTQHQNELPFHQIKICKPTLLKFKVVYKFNCLIEFTGRTVSILSKLGLMNILGSQAKLARPVDNTCHLK